MSTESELCCAICAATWDGTIYAADKAGWDWFTGYLTMRFVVCPICISTETPLIAMRRKQSREPCELPRTKYAHKRRIILEEI